MSHLFRKGYEEPRHHARPVADAQFPEYPSEM